MMPRAITYTAREGVTFSAAQTASGTESTMAADQVAVLKDHPDCRRACRSWSPLSLARS